MSVLQWKMLFITILFLSFFMFRAIFSQQCGNVDTYSIYQHMLKSHTFKTFNAQPNSLDCRNACKSDVRCQSYNYVMFKDICELNNRTKEARPEDFVKDKERYYMKKALQRGTNKRKSMFLFPTMLYVTNKRESNPVKWIHFF